MTISEIISKVLDGNDLTPDEASSAMKLIMSGELTPAQIAGLLIALRMKGETSEEIAAFAKVMREFAVKISPKVSGDVLVDTCGTGGDGSGTFNISTASALVVAGAGVPVVKHGNRSVSSLCGSADVLEHLGVNIMVDASEVERLVEQVGIGFLFAPSHHPAMKHAIGVRRELGVRTVFNILGPLTNPAGANAQVMGVYSPALTEKLADVMRLLGLQRSMVVHGSGLDEISTAGETIISELRDGKIESYTITPEDLGFTRVSISALLGGDAEKNAQIMLDILKGEKGAMRDIVLLNAGAAIYVAGNAADIQEGIEIAANSVDNGAALEKLHSLVRETGGQVGF